MTFDDDIGIIKHQRKRVIQMEKTMNVNGFLASLPKIVQKKVWKVIDENGNVVQGVGATDNLKRTAQAYIDAKYPGRKMKLVFSHFNGMITLPR